MEREDRSEQLPPEESAVTPASPDGDALPGESDSGRVDGGDAAVDAPGEDATVDANAGRSDADPSADDEHEIVEADAETADAETADAESADDVTAEATEEIAADDGTEEDAGAEGDVVAEEDVAEDDEEVGKRDWYILKVQSNRERTVCDALRRRVEMHGLTEFFGDLLVPTEDVAEFKNGKRRVVKRKLYPGYIVVNMEINDDTWFLVRETPGIGDFTGSAGKPTPMLPHEVERIQKMMFPEEAGDEPIKTAIPYKVGDRVRIKDGTFLNFEGDVDGLDEVRGLVTVMINIFGRSTPVELEHWQMESV